MAPKGRPTPTWGKARPAAPEGGRSHPARPSPNSVLGTTRDGELMLHVGLQADCPYIYMQSVEVDGRRVAPYIYNFIREPVDLISA